MAAKIDAVRVAASDLIDRRGVDGFTMGQVAEIAGVSRPWLNSVFDGRTHLVAEVVCERAAASMCSVIDGFIGELDSTSSAEEICRGFDEMLAALNTPDVVARHWQFIEMVAWSVTDPGAVEPVRTALRDVHASVERFLIAIDDAGRLRPEVGPISGGVLVLAASVAARFESLDPGIGGGSLGGLGLLRWTFATLLTGASHTQAAAARQPDGRGCRPAVPSPEVDRRDPVRNRIRAAASRELGSSGSVGFNLRKVTSDAEVSWSGLYGRYADRRGVLSDAGQELLGRLQETSVVQTGAAVGGSSDSIGVLADALAEFSRSSGRQFLIALAAARHGDATSDLMAEQAARFDAHADALREALGLGTDVAVEGIAGICRVIACTTGLVDALPQVDVAPSDLDAIYRLLLTEALRAASG